MRLFAIAIFASTIAAFAQSSTQSTASPTVGFVPAAGGTGLTPIIGIPGASRLDRPLTVAGASALFVASRGGYVLAAMPSGLSMALLRPALALQNGLVFTPLIGTVAEADLAAFSPNGTAAAVYSRLTNTVQILSGLPAAPLIRGNLPVSAQLLQLAISDDAQSVWAQQEGGAIVSLRTGNSRITVQGATSLAFAPGSDTVFLANAAANELGQLNAAGAITAIPAADIRDPASLVTTADGKTLLVGSPSKKTVWTTDLLSGKTTGYAVAAPVKSLRSLAVRDTFLITYEGGAYGLLTWRNNQLLTYFVGVFRDGVN
jgi:hypothetical protein